MQTATSAQEYTAAIGGAADEHSEHQLPTELTPSSILKPNGVTAVLLFLV
jgi:hypothetical protein